MKKIVGIIAAVAMAASVFAFEFQGGISADLNLFKMTFEDGAQPTVISPYGRGGGNYWGSRFQVNASADKCGGNFIIQLGDWWSPKPNLTPKSWNIWIQPIDALKISVFDCADTLNSSFTESLRVIGIGYDHDNGAGVFSYVNGGFSKGDPLHNTIQVSVNPIDMLTINLTTVTPFIAGGVIKEMGLTAKVAADFGTLGFMFYGKSETDFFDKIGFGLGYSNSFDMVDFFVDGAAFFAPYASTFGMLIAADAQAIFKFDDIKISVYGIYQNAIYEGSDSAGALWAILRFDYKLDSAGLYIEVQDNNILTPNVAGFKKDDDGNVVANDKYAALSIKPGVTFNIGAASVDAGVKVSIQTFDGGKVSIAVPFEVSIGL